MRKVFLIVFLIVGTLVISSLLKYVPSNFITLTYIPDIGKFYNDIKATEIGDSFLNNLGLESMMDSLIRSQAQAYDIDADKLYKIKEILIIGTRNWIAVIIGPVEEADKIIDYIKSTGILPESEKAKVYVDKIDNNLVFYSSNKDDINVLSILKKEEGKVPSWVGETLKDQNVDLVYYSAEKGVFESHLKVYPKGKVLVEEGTGKYLEKDVKEKLENIMQGKSFGLNDIIDGEGFLLVNIKDGKSILDLLQVLGILELLKEEGMDVNIAEKFGGKIFIGMEYSKAIVDAFYGGENNEAPIISGYITFNGNPEDILKDKIKNCKKEDGYYLCGDMDLAKVVFEKNKVKFTIPSDGHVTSSVNKNVFQKIYKGNENIMLYFDFAKVLNDLFGLDVNSYLMFKVWTEKGEVRSYGELR